MSLLTDSFETFETKGSKLTVNYNEPCDHLPSWFDLQRFIRAKSLLKRYFFSIWFGHLSGLILLVFIRSIYKTLAKTGKSADLVALFHRYIDTAKHVKLWYEGNVWNKTDDAYKSLQTVKRMHQNTSDKQNEGKLINRDQMSISLRDMTLTQFAFVGLLVLYPGKIGFSSKKEDVELILYFWAVIGYMLGIKDEYNLCIGDYHTIHQRCQTILDKNFRTELIKPDKDCNEMSRQIEEAVREYIWGLHHKSHMKYLFDLISVKATFKLNKTEEFYYSLTKIIMQKLIHYNVIAFILNHIIRFSLYMIQTKWGQRMAVKNLERKMKSCQ